MTYLAVLFGGLWKDYYIQLHQNSQ